MPEYQDKSAEQANPRFTSYKPTQAPDDFTEESYGSRVSKTFDNVDGSIKDFRSGHYADLLMNAAGNYGILTKQGRVYCASMQAGATFGTALTTTAVTITLHNPPQSRVDLVILAASFSMTAGQVTTTNAPVVVYAANMDTDDVIPATNTAVVVRNALLGGPAGFAKVYSATTLPSAPIVIRVFPWGHVCQTLGTVIQTKQSTNMDYVDGAIVLQPNTSVTLQGIATTTQITGIGGFVWAEIPF